MRRRIVAGMLAVLIFFSNITMDVSAEPMNGESEFSNEITRDIVSENEINSDTVSQNELETDVVDEEEKIESEAETESETVLGMENESETEETTTEEPETEIVEEITAGLERSMTQSYLMDTTTPYEGDYLLIANTNIDPTGTYEDTGAFPPYEAAVAMYSENGGRDIYGISSEDIYGYDKWGRGLIDPASFLPEPELNTETENSVAPLMATSVSDTAYELGDTRTFYLDRSDLDEYNAVNCVCVAVGTYSTVWVPLDDPIYIKNASLMQTYMSTLAAEFDSKYPKMTEMFGDVRLLDNSYGDGDGKTALVCYDIDGDGEGTASSYVAGYFFAADTNFPFSNATGSDCDLLHIDSWQGMNRDIENQILNDVTASKGTIVHEFQHMINFAVNRANDPALYTITTPTYLNEAFSMAAEHLCYGSDEGEERVRYYNYYPYVSRGYVSLMRWGAYDTLSNYSLSYLFGQYIRTQYKNGDTIYKDAMNEYNDSSESLLTIIAELLGVTDKELLLNFRAALFQKNAEGPYGFKGEEWAEAISQKVVTGESTSLYPGAAVVVPLGEAHTPVDAGENISFAGMYLELTDEDVSVSVLGGNSITEADGTLRLSASVYPSGVSQSVIFTLPNESDRTYATVTTDGLVTALANGSVTVRATSVYNPDKYADITITISGQNRVGVRKNEEVLDEGYLVKYTATYPTTAKLYYTYSYVEPYANGNLQTIDPNTVTDPTAQSEAVPTEGFSLTKAGIYVIKVIGIADGYQSDVVTSVYEIEELTMPIISKTQNEDGTYTVSIQAQEGATIAYTLDGSDPVRPATEDTLYTGPFQVTTPGWVYINAIAYKPGNITSAVRLETVEVPVAVPQIIVEDILGGKEVTIETATEGAKIYYTLDGSEPSIESALYTDTLSFNEAAETVIKAIAVVDESLVSNLEEDDEYNTSSETASETIIVGKTRNVVSSQADSILAEGDIISLYSATTDAYIYYTVDGTDPSISETSSLYTDYLTMEDEILQIQTYARSYGNVDSDILEFVYVPEGASQVYLYADDTLIDRYLSVTEAVAALKTDAESEDREAYRIVLGSDADMGDADLVLPESVKYCELDLNGYTITVEKDASLALDKVYNGTFYMIQESSVYIYAPENSVAQSTYKDLKFDYAQEKGGLYVSSGQYGAEPESAASQITVQFENVEVLDNEILEIDGILYMDEASTFTTADLSLSNADTDVATSLLGTISAEKAEWIKGTFDIGELTITGNVKIETDSILNVRGTVSLGDLCLYEQTDSESSNVYFNIVQLLEENGAVKNTGVIAFDGTLTDVPVSSQRCQIVLAKQKITVGSDGTESAAEFAKFDAGETVATVKQSEDVISTEYFVLKNAEADERIIRNGNNLVAVQVAVQVSLLGEGENKAVTKEYLSMEEAVVNLNADFGGKKGNYTVTLIDNCKLNANVIFPAFVTGLELKALGKDDLEASHSLDLNGYTVSTGAVVSLYNDLHLTNTSQTAAKFTTTAKNSAEGFAFKILADISTANTAYLSNLTLSATNGTVLFESADTESFHSADAAITAKEIVVDSGKWELGTLTVTNFINNSIADVIKLNNVQNVDNKAESILMVDTYTQKTNGITNLESGSKLLVKTSAKIYNTVIGGKEGIGTEPVYVYRMSDYADKNGAEETAICSVVFEGKVTSTNEALKIAFGVLTPEADVECILESNGDLSELKPRTKLFTTSVKTFPVELFTVNQNSESPAYTDVYQQDGNIYVGREWIAIYAKQVNGNETELKRFIRWTDASAYIETLANTPMEYVVEISEDVELFTDLTLPKKVNGITFRGVDTDLSDDNNRITLTYTGDIRLASDTTFENIDLVAEKYNTATKSYVPYQSAVTLNSKTMRLKNSSAEFSSIVGNNKSQLVMESAQIEVIKAVTSLGYLDMKIMENIEGETAPYDTVLTADNVTVIDTLTMQSAKIDCVNKIALKNVVTMDAYNVLSYGGNTSKDGLTISGSVTAGTADGMEDETITIRRTEVTSEGIKNINKQAKVRKNAIELQIKSMESAGYTNGALLCTAEKAGAGWFVVGSEWETTDDVTMREISHGAYKVKNKEIHCGEIEENVKLYSSDSGEDGTYAYESGFATLQEALTEIDKLAVSDAYYRIELVSAEENVVTFNSKAPTFPSKTKGITIAGDSKLASPYFYFKGNLTLKSNTTFEDMVFVPQTKSFISLGSYELRLENCAVDISRSGVEFGGITGSGVNGTSALILEDTVLAVAGNINNVGTLVFTGEAATEPLSSIATFSLLRSTPAYPKLIADGTVNVGSVVLEKDGYITGLAAVTRSKEMVTKITPQITINKDVASEEGHTLYLDLQEKVSGQFVSIDFNNAEMTDILNSGVSMAKALYMTYPNVKAAQRNNESALVKSGSYLTYFADGYGVMLSYKEIVMAEDRITSQQTIQIPCRTFADAVTEINNQKTKRDYTIILQPKITEISGADQCGAVPKALTMPNRNYVDTLTIQAPADNDTVKLGFINSITLTCDVVLENVQFVQMMKVGSVYQPSDFAKENFPGALTFNTAGFDVTIKGNNTFNTPLVMNGSNKTVLTFDENGTITTLTNGYDGQNNSSVVENVIYGSLTNLDTVNVNDCNLTLRAYKTSPTATSDTESKNKITTVNVYGTVMENEGEDEETGNITVVSPTAKGEFVCTNYNSNDGKLLVEGKVNLKNVTLEGDYVAAIHADTNFDITGNLISRSNRAVLETRLKGAGKEPYLNISGNVVRVGETQAIEVAVYPEITAVDTKTPVNLKGVSGGKAPLLTAKSAQSADFRLSVGNYAGGEYSAEEPKNEHGYMLLKISGKIYVYNGEQVNVAVYKGDCTGADTSELVGYYPSFKDATTDVDAIKDKTQKYTYVLTKTNGTLASPVSVTLPTQAESVTITRLASNNGNNEKIYLSGNISLKCDTTFANVEFAPVNRGTGTIFSIAAGGFDVALQDVTVSGESDKMALKDISGNGKQVVMLDSSELEITGSIISAAEVMVLEDAEIKGNVKTTTLSLYNSSIENAGITLAVNGTVTVDTLNNNGTAQNTLEYSRNTSTKNSNLTINKDIINETAENLVVLKQQDAYSLTALTKVSGKVTVANAAKALTLPKASTDSFVLETKCIAADGQMVSVNSSTEGYTVVKADKGVYIADNTLNNDIVQLERTVYGTDDEIIVESVTNCLDYSQAVNEINTLADAQYMQYFYEIQFLTSGSDAKGGSAIDTNVKDANPYGTFTLPKSNAKRSLVVKGVEVNKTTVPFSGNISGQGMVTLQDMVLNPVKSGTDSTPADTKISITADKTTPQLTLINVSTNEKSAADAKSTGFIGSIGGTRNKTDILLIDCGNLIVKSGITNINSITLNNTKIISDGNVTLNTIRLLNVSSWDSLGKMTVTDVYVEVPENGASSSYIGTKQDRNGNPQFVVNGDVTDDALLCKVYTTDTTIADGTAIFAGTSVKELTGYENKPLVSAKKASADKFRAYAYKDVTDGSIVSYKDGVYVKNGNLGNMQIKLVERDQSAEGVVLSTSYAATFEDAVTTINNKADTTAYYEIQFIQAGTEDAPVEIKTTKKGTAYGALTLPSKAAGVTILGYSDGLESGEPCTVIKYTGTLKASCDVTFENILLTEGKVDTKQPDGFAESGIITPTPANNVTITFKDNVYTYQNSVAKSINAENSLVVGAINAGKGHLVFTGNTVSTEKTINIGSLTLLEGASLNAVGKVTIADLIADANEANSLSSEAAISIGNIKNQNTGDNVQTANVRIQSDFTKITKEGAFGNSQLTISGLVEDVNVKLNYRKYILSSKIYVDMEQSDFENLMMQTDGKPDIYKKLATVPKASLDWIKVVGTDVAYTAYDHNSSETQIYLYKYETGLYLTDLKPLVLVNGYEAPTGNENAYTNENLCYQAEFLSWEQAVKEIEKINDKTRCYELKLLDTIGYNLENQKVDSPISTVTMPSKAAEVFITSEAGEENGIFFTGTNVALKCPVRMENVGFTCVKKYGSGSNIYYEPVTYTMNIGNFKLVQKDMVSEFCNEETVAYTVSGSAKGILELVSDTTGSRQFAAIKGMDKLIVDYTNAQSQEDGYENFTVDCSGDVSVKNMEVSNSTVEAKNMTVSTLATLDEAALCAGTSAANDGRMTIKDMKLRDNGNALRAEQNKSGATQLTINGTVTAATDATADALDEGTLEITLYYNNYKKGSNYQKPAQLYNGMILCIAQKAASSLFVPAYTETAQNGDIIKNGMGFETDTHGIYKSGKNICYGITEDTRCN